MEIEPQPKNEYNVNPLFQGINSGIDPQRLEGSSSYPVMLCQSCDKIYWNPLTCSDAKCTATYCESCLLQYFKKEEICPKCKNNTKFEPSSFLQNNVLNSLQFKCINSPSCSQIIPYDLLPFHFCDFDQLNCSIKDCPWKGDRKTKKTHEDSCEYKIVPCTNSPNCEMEMKRNELEQHLTLCEYQIISCPSACGEANIRRDIKEHLKTSCPLKEIICEYQMRGCQLSPQRRNYEQHAKECSFQPIKLKCEHEVNKKDVDAHKEECELFPLRCEKCTYVFPRHILVGHQCLPFLLDKIGKLESQVNLLGKQLNSVNNELENRLKPETCSFCHKIQIRGQFQECTKCHKLTCCAERCPETTLPTCKGCLPIECTSCKKLVPKLKILTCDKCTAKGCSECQMKCKECQKNCCTKCFLFYEDLCILCIQSILQNIEISKLTKSGFKLVYNEDYSHHTTKSELFSILSTYGEDELLCVGGMRTGSENIELCAFGLTKNVISQTTRNKPNMHGSVYWYLTDRYSFGFSPVDKINQYSADVEGQSDKKRLSWRLCGSSGGYRVGDVIDLHSSTSWKKIILIKL